MKKATRPQRLGYSKWWVLLLAVSALVLAACSSDDVAESETDEPTTAATEADDETTEPDADATTPDGAEAIMPAEMTGINVGIISKAISFYWDLGVADEEGFFADNNLDPEYTEIGVPGDLTRAAAAGETDFVVVATDALVRAVDAGAPLTNIAGEAYPTYSLVTTSEIESYEDLRGAEIAIADPQSGSTTLLRELLAANGISADDDVDLVPAGGTGERFAALSSGSVDAALLLPPVTFNAEADGFPVLGYTTDEILEFYITTHGVNTDWAADNREVVVAYVRAISQAQEWLNDPSNRDRAVEILMEWTGVEEETAEQTYDLMIDRYGAIGSDGRIVPEAMENVLRITEESDDRLENLQMEDFVDTTYWEEAHGQ